MTDLFHFFRKIRRDTGQSYSGASQLHDHAGLTRVFVSSRYADQPGFVTETEIIQMPNNDQRDLRIVRHLSLRYLEKLTVSNRELVTNEIAASMQGSAIWARMILQYLQKTCSRTTKEASIKRTLFDMPPPQGLSEVYIKLFEKLVDGVAVNRWILGRCLDLMAANSERTVICSARRVCTCRES